MPGPSHSLKALEIRRRLLTSEAEIHRQRIREEWGDFTASFQELEGTLTSIRSAFSIVSMIATGVSSFRRLREKRGTISRIMAGAGLASTLWLAARSRHR